MSCQRWLRGRIRTNIGTADPAAWPWYDTYPHNGGSIANLELYVRERFASHNMSEAKISPAEGPGNSELMIQPLFSRPLHNTDSLTSVTKLANEWQDNLRTGACSMHAYDRPCYALEA